MNKLDIKTAKSETLHIKSFTKGLDLTDLCHDNDPGILREGKNVWCEKGVLTTRPALMVKTDNLLNDNTYGGMYFLQSQVTDVEIEEQGIVRRLIMEGADWDDVEYICFTHLINPDGSLYKTVKFSFSRLTSNIFYIPKKINFFKGEPQNGAGIFAAVSLVNCENFTETDSRIFELNSDMDEWVRIYSTYIPTVLINGRGNRYEFAKNTNQAYTGNPTKLEGLNALNNSFYAYFSTDGYSSSFRLPLAELSDERVDCRLYYSVENYVDWIIPQKESSATATLHGVEVTMNVNREKGIVSFSVPDGEYEMPLISNRNENNLRIKASKDCGYTLGDIAAADCVLNKDGKIVLGSKNTLFIANYKKPLYFPVDSVELVDGNDSVITALAALNGKVIAFTKNRVYSAAVKSGKAVNYTSLLAENDGVFYEGDEITIECLEYGVGCDQKSSVVCADKKLFFRGTNGQFYCLSSGKVNQISEKISEFIPQICGSYTTVSAVGLGKNILFVWENKALVCQLDGSKDFCWYYWEFPQDIKFYGGFESSRGPKFLCVNREDDTHFIAGLGGRDDTYLKGGYSNTETESCNIKYSIRTGKLSLGCDNTMKRIDFINLRLKGYKTDVVIKDRPKTSAIRLKDDEYTLVRLTPGLCNVAYTDIAFSGVAPFSIGSMDIKYTTLEI